MLSTCKLVNFLTLCFIAISLSSAQGQNPPRIRPKYGPQKPQPPVSNRVQPARQENTQALVGPPKGFDLKASARIDQILDFWEQKTSGIKTFRANFTRWVYNPVFGPKVQPQKITAGEVRYAAPDKGMIKETRVAVFNAALEKAGQKWPFQMKKDADREHWVCDGRSVFEFNQQAKQLIETKLSPTMQGRAIAEGPLPFMFGAKAATIRARYWIREIPRTKQTDPYHLEFVPKGRGANFSRVRVRLDSQEFLPEIMEIHDLNNIGRSVYQFEKRRVNVVSDNVRAFWNSFVRPDLPRGWQKVTLDAGAAPADPTRQAQAPTNPNR